MSKRSATRQTVRINTEALREMRKLAAFSATKLAKKAGITPPYLSQIENGHRDPSEEVVGRLAAALGVSPASLFSRSSQPTDTEAAVG